MNRPKLNQTVPCPAGACRRRRGFALMMVMVLVAIGAVLGLSYINSSTVRLAASNNQLVAARAQYLAESGLQHCLWQMRHDASVVPSTAAAALGPYQVDDTDDGYYFYATAVTGATNTYELVSFCQIENLMRTVSMTVKFTSNYSSTVTALSPYTYWRLGETSGPTAYDTMGVRNGTYTNGVQLSQATAIPFSGNTAAAFDGTNDYVNLGGLDISSSRATILAWFKSDDWGQTEGRIISKADGTKENQHYWMLSTTKSGSAMRLAFRLTTSGVTTLTASSGDLTAGQWVFAAAVYDGSKMYLYKDGVLVGSCTKTGSIKTQSNKNAWIGGNPSGSTAYPFDGTIDEVTILKTALTAAQIKALYQARLPAIDILTWAE